MGANRYEPFKDLLSLQDRMNRLFEETLARGTTKEEEAGSWQWSPVVDIIETDSEIIMRAELPGIDLDMIDLHIKDNVLTLRGERRFDNATRKEHYHRIERSYGSFVRSFTLPSTTEAERVKAQLRDGVLEVTIPKRDGGRSEPITVEVT